MRSDRDQGSERDEGDGDCEASQTGHSQVPPQEDHGERNAQGMRPQHVDVPNQLEDYLDVDRHQVNQLT